MRIFSSLVVIEALISGSMAVAADPQIGGGWSYSAPKTCQAFDKGVLSPELQALNQQRERRLYELLHLETAQVLDPGVAAHLKSLLNGELKNSLVKYGAAVVRGCGALPTRALSQAELGQVEMDTIGQIADIVTSAERDAICKGAVDNKAKLNTILQNRANEKIALVTHAEVAISSVAIEFGAAARAKLAKIPVRQQEAQQRPYLLPKEKAEFEKLLKAYFGEDTGKRKVEPKEGGGVYHHPGNPLIAFQKKLQKFREETQRTLETLGNQELYREDARAEICNSVNSVPAPQPVPRLVAPPRPATRPKKQ